MLNRRGSLPVIVLVVLTLVLTSSTLLVFHLNFGKALDNVVGVGILEDVYVEENLAKYYVYIVGKDLLKDDKLGPESFKEEFSKYSFDEVYLQSLQNRIAEDKFELDENGFILKDANVTFVGQTDLGVYVYHVSKIEVKFWFFVSSI